ncbi:MAG: GntR family transcriptional regulator [Chitinivibrionales bacterium]|nr:GntR family transcriptional regulator [Chitinivibrionales bacterium]
MPHTPIQDALEKLQLAVDLARQRGDTRLPGIRAMATEAGVSTATMGRAVRQLAARGVITVVPKSGIRLVDIGRSTAPEPPQSFGHRRHRFHAVLARVKDDILRGNLDVQPRFPTMKEFCHTYGVCRQTAARMLEALVADDVLEATGRSYALAGQLPAGMKPLTVVYICRAHRGQHMVSVSGMNMAERLQTLEARIGLRGLRLEVCYIRYVGTEQVIDRDWGALTPRQIRQQGIAGFVVERTAVDEMYVPLVQSLSRLMVPVVVFDPYPPHLPQGNVISSVSRQSRVVLIHYSLDHDIGRDVARYCLAMGHTNMAFLHPVGGASYSAARLAGMRAELADRECGDIRAVGEYKSARPRTYFRSLFTGAESRVVGELLEGLPADLAPMAEGFADGTLLTPPGSNAPELLRQVAPVLLAAVRNTLAHSDITLWVCASEPLAVVVYHCLRRLGVRVPDDLSYVCIDGGIQALLLRITSYTMSVDETVSAAVNAIVNPTSVWGRRGGGLRRIHTTGRMQERETVRALAKP